MKPLKPRWWAGGLLHLTVLLSLAGLRVDPGLYLPPPRALLRDELPLPFPGPGAWGRAGQLHPKGPEPDPAAPIGGRLLRELRALEAPFIPHTQVDAWLVHSVAAGDGAAARGMLGAAAAASSGGAGAGADAGSQAAAGGGDPRVGRGSPLAAEEEPAPADPTAQVRDAGGRANQENEVLGEICEGMDHSFEQEEKNSLQQNEDGNKIEKTTESRNERHLNGTDTSFSLEDLFQLISSQPEYSLESISLEDTPPFPGRINDSMNLSAHYNVNFSQAISQDVNLHEAMLLCPNNSIRRDSVARTSQAQEPFLQLNFHTDPEQTFLGTNVTGLLPPVDNQVRNLTSQDLLYDLDANIFDEINLMSLATLESFDPMEVAQLFEKPDSDSGLSLNSSPNSTSTTKSNSSHSLCDEGATGYGSDPELFPHNLEGAVGGYYAEPSKLFHMDQRNEPALHQDLVFQHVLHNHTYHLQTEPEPISESFSRSGKSLKMSRDLDRDGNLSRDERRAKALHIPFSVDEIVHMPVDSFNSMLTRCYLTDLQVSLIRDIRRRGKNKVAAQNCRRRKLDIIFNLENDVCDLQAKKETLKREGSQCNKAINIMKQKLHDLYHDVFSRLRDEQGRPVNPNQYALQCSHDGTVLIVPKELVTSGHKKEVQKGKRKSERN